MGTAFEIFWMFFGVQTKIINSYTVIVRCPLLVRNWIFIDFIEPALFGVTGASIKINSLDEHVVTLGVSILVICGIVRICCTILIAFGDNLNLKEKVIKIWNSMCIHKYLVLQF